MMSPGAFKSGAEDASRFWRMERSINLHDPLLRSSEHIISAYNTDYLNHTAEFRKMKGQYQISAVCPSSCNYPLSNIQRKYCPEVHFSDTALHSVIAISLLLGLCEVITASYW